LEQPSSSAVLPWVLESAVMSKFLSTCLSELHRGRWEDVMKVMGPRFRLEAAMIGWLGACPINIRVVNPSND